MYIVYYMVLTVLCCVIPLQMATAHLERGQVLQGAPGWLGGEKITWCSPLFGWNIKNHVTKVTCGTHQVKQETTCIVLMLEHPCPRVHRWVCYCR